MTSIINAVCNEGKLIEEWKTARIYPIHVYKTGDENEVSNYRGVALLDAGYKLLANTAA